MKLLFVLAWVFISTFWELLKFKVFEPIRSIILRSLVVRYWKRSSLQNHINYLSNIRLSEKKGVFQLWDMDWKRPKIIRNQIKQGSLTENGQTLMRFFRVAPHNARKAIFSWKCTYSEWSYIRLVKNIARTEHNFSTVFLESSTVITGFSLSS